MSNDYTTKPEPSESLKSLFDNSLSADAMNIAKLQHDFSVQSMELRLANKHIAALEALVFRATTESVVTMSDDPGCFFCDRAEEHAGDCPAVKAMDLEATP